MTNCVMIKCEPTVYEQEPQKEVNTFSDEKSADVESSDECLWFDDGAAEESDEMRAKPEVESTKNYEKKQLKLKKTATKVKKVKNAFTYEEVKCKKCDYVAPSIKMLHEHRKEYHRKLKDSNKIAKQKSTSGP